VGQDSFNHILGKLVFFKTKIYFAVLKIIVVTSYIFITIEAVSVGKEKGVLEFFEIMKYIFISASPFLLSIFFKSGKGILSNENKKAVQKILQESEKSDLVKPKFEMHHALISSCFQACLKSKKLEQDSLAS
jgi:hypothetical protein